ncbi:MAG: hypothetical protein ACRCVD_03435, partial [Halioglobus sp.]
GAPLGFTDYLWQTDASGSTLLIPAGNAFNAGSTNFAKYYRMNVRTPILVDYNYLVTPQDPLDTTTRFSFTLKFVEGINRWVMVYSFVRVSGSGGYSGADPLWIYMRVGGYGYNPSQFGPAQKLKFPANFQLRGKEWGAVQVAYSLTQQRWLFSAYVYDRTDGTVRFRNSLWSITDSFECP